MFLTSPIEVLISGTTELETVAKPMAFTSCS